MTLIVLSYVFCICCWPHSKLLITVAEFHWTSKNLLHVFFQSGQKGGEQLHNLKWLTFTRRSCSPHAMFFLFFPMTFDTWVSNMFQPICWDIGSASCYTVGQSYLCDRWVGLGIEHRYLYGTNQIAAMPSSIKKMAHHLIPKFNTKGVDVINVSEPISMQHATIACEWLSWGMQEKKQNTWFHPDMGLTTSMCNIKLC